MYISWTKPDGTTAITTLHEATDAKEEAEKLLSSGLLPSDWEYEIIDGDIPGPDALKSVAAQNTRSKRPVSAAGKT